LGSSPSGHGSPDRAPCPGNEGSGHEEDQDPEERWKDAVPRAAIAEVGTEKWRRAREDIVATLRQIDAVLSGVR